jgi:subtilase family serine protease
MNIPFQGGYLLLINGLHDAGLGDARRRSEVLRGTIAKWDNKQRHLLDDQQSKASPNFHSWLTPEQFGAQFGVADSDLLAVTQWLSSQGFTDINVGPGRSVMEFSGTAGQIRNSFHTEIHRFHVGTEDHTANVSDPQIPAALAPVVKGIVSLHNFPRNSHAKIKGQFRRQLGQPFEPIVRVAMLEGDVFSIDPSQLPQSTGKSNPTRSVLRGPGACAE